MRIYIGSGQSPTSNLKYDRVCVSCLNALKFLQWGARMVKRGRRICYKRGSLKRSSRSPTAMDGMVEDEE
jgi:hypothetical protein